MLIYHSSLDAYHCFLRVVYFLSKAEDKPFEIDKIRIVDFFMSSPASLASFKFPINLRGKRKSFCNKSNGYNQIINQKSLFFEMQHIHRAVFDMLASIELIDCDKYRHGEIYLLRDNLTDEMTDIISNNSSIDEEIGDFAIHELAQLPLLGLNGLKDRSGLMDYRYDLV